MHRSTIAMNKLSLSFNLVLIFSLLAISMVESSRILNDIPETTGAAATTDQVSSIPDAEFILVNDDNELREAEASVIEETKPVTFIETIPIIMNVEDTATPCMIENKHLLNDNANQIILGSVKITITTNGGRVTEVTDTSKGAAATDETEEKNEPFRESKDTSDDESVPGGIERNVFFGKAISGSSETYNMSSNDFYNRIFQTMNKEVFVVGRFAKLADTPHNRMVLDKSGKEETNTGDDCIENKEA